MIRAANFSQSSHTHFSLARRFSALASQISLLPNEIGKSPIADKSLCGDGHERLRRCLPAMDIPQTSRPDGSTRGFGAAQRPRRPWRPSQARPAALASTGSVPAAAAASPAGAVHRPATRVAPPGPTARSNRPSRAARFPPDNRPLPQPAACTDHNVLPRPSLRPPAPSPGRISVHPAPT